MNPINEIVTLMEQMPTPGMTSTMSGAAQAQSAMNVLPGDHSSPGFAVDVEEDDGFDPKHIAAAKDLIALVGCAERARELIDKVDDAMEVFDDGEDDLKTIDLVAQLIPDTPDMPMERGITSISSMYDPNFGE